MTNAEIIANAKKLNGVSEEAHTFAKWKQLGYCVRKGEKATFKAQIWKARERTIEVDGKEEKDLAVFMKYASFFTASQVEKIA